MIPLSRIFGIGGFFSFNMFKNASIYIAGFMVVAFLFIGFYLLFTNVPIKGLEGFKRTLFIIILFAYGSYRGYRVYNAIKQTREK